MYNKKKVCIRKRVRGCYWDTSAVGGDCNGDCDGVGTGRVREVCVMSSLGT